MEPLPMKGILLAGGSGSRLFPVTSSINKHLLPIYDKPMVYYALTTLISASICEICLICNEKDFDSYKNLLGNGSEFGISIEYIIQDQPKGISQALSLASGFIGENNVSVILGDNVFVDQGDIRKNVENFKSGAHIFALPVKNPENYGIIEVNADLEPISLVEKPQNSTSRLAIPGFYIFDSYCSQYAASVDLSDRGEYEIIDLLKRYLDKDKLKVSLLSRGVGWIDAGTSKNHAIVSRYIEAKQQMHGVMIGSPHEAAHVRGFIDDAQLLAFAKNIKPSEYSDYLENLILYSPTLRN